jgi:integrase/recombinase XerD
MTQLAPHLTAFLREHLPRERRASVHTGEAYAYSFQLLVTFVARRLRKRPCLLQIEDLDFAMILAFSRSDRRTATRRYS